MFTQRTALRWSDYDALQHVNNVRYFEFMQDARIGFIENLGIDRSTLTVTGHVVARAEIDYLKPVELDVREILVHIWVERIGGASYDIAYEFIDGAGTVYAKAKTVMVTVDMSTQTVIRVPDDLRVHLERGLKS